MAIHATAVTIGGFALLIQGPSRAGKSTLALALIAHTSALRPIVLVGDDRILLRRRGSDVLASPHPRIAGLIERRGCGILAMPHRSDVPVFGVVTLASPAPSTGGRGDATSCALAGQNFPVCACVGKEEHAARVARVLAWSAATLAAHPAVKTKRPVPASLKD